MNNLNISGEIEIGYGMISGWTKSDCDPLLSNYMGTFYEGVLRLTKIKNLSSDATDAYYSKIDIIPFGLVKNQPIPIQIQIENPLKAEFLLENLQTIFKNCEIVKETGKNFKYSEVLRDSLAVENTEQMITCGTNLLAYGKIKSIPIKGWTRTNFLSLSEPSGDHPFILTSLSQAELIQRLRSRRNVTFICVVSFGIFFLIPWAYRTFSRRKNRI